MDSNFGIHVASWNINGWTQRNEQLRSDILLNLKCDIICISETHCSDNINQQPSLPGYTWYGHCRKLQHFRGNRQFGGVGMFVKHELLKLYKIRIIDQDFDGILGLLFTHKHSNMTFIVYSCYLAPEESPWGRNSTSFYAHLLTQVYMYTHVDHILICGDLNSRTGSMKDYIEDIDKIPHRNAIDEVKNNHGESLCEFLMESKMCIVNGRITPEYDNFTSTSVRGRAVVDYILVPHMSLETCTECHVYTSNELVEMFNMQSIVSDRCKPPDHSLVSLIVKFHAGFESFDLLNDKDTVQDSPHSNNFMRKKLYKFDSIPEHFLSSQIWLQAINELISQIEVANASQEELDSVYHEFSKILFQEMDNDLQYVSCSSNVRKRFKNHKPYWNAELTDLWKNMRMAESNFIKFHGPGRTKRWLQNSFKEAQNKFDKCLRNTERKYYRNYTEQLEEINTNDPKQFWEHIKKLGPQHRTNIPLKVYNDDGVTLNSDIDFVLQTWQTDFSALLNQPEHTEFDDSFLHDSLTEKQELEREMKSQNYMFNQEINHDITTEEIDIALRKLKNGKAVGPDFIPNEILKTGGVTFWLYKLFSHCFKNGLMPSVWKKAVNSPIPKGSSKNPYVPLNYRGISLLSCVFKLYTSILNTRITQYCDKHKLIVEEQNGFRKGRACVEHLFVLTSLIRNRKNSGQDTYVAFVDFQKAFDWVNRDLLLYKLLYRYNIDGHMYDTIKAMYTNLYSCVRLNQMYTQWFDVTLGVRQGDTLSPTLFSLYINDLAAGIKSLNCGIDCGQTYVSTLLYADDIVLVAPSEEKLQHQLNYMHDWCRKWRLLVNNQKTNVVHFRPKNTDRTSIQFCYGDNVLQVVNKYKYLGIVLDEFLDFSTSAELLADAGGRAFGALRNKIQHLKDIRYNTYTKMYCTAVAPILDYCAGVWGNNWFGKIESVQNRAIRSFLGVHKFTPNHAIQGDMGWDSCSLRRKLEICRLWNRIVTMQTFRLPRKVLEWDIMLCRNNWSQDVKSLFYEIGLQNVYTNKHVCDLDVVCEKLRALEHSKWESSRYNKTKLLYYNMYKAVYEPEEYVISGISKHRRSLLAQIRAGVLPLQVEVGRFRGVQYQDRLCLVCGDGNVEDEYHLLCVCNKYKDLRTEMFNKVDALCPGFKRLDFLSIFVILMSEYQSIVSLYVLQCMQRRQSMMYSQ